MLTFSCDFLFNFKLQNKPGFCHYMIQSKPGYIFHFFPKSTHTILIAFLTDTLTINYFGNVLFLLNRSCCRHIGTLTLDQNLSAVSIENEVPPSLSTVL